MSADLINTVATIAGVFVAIVGALALAGILMALIIVPLIGSAMVIGRYLYCKILDIDPWPDAEEDHDQPPDHAIGSSNGG